MTVLNDAETQVREVLRLAQELECAARQWQRDIAGKDRRRHQRAEGRLSLARRELETAIRQLAKQGTP